MPRTLAVLLLLALLPTDAVRARAATRGFVLCTDYSTGSLSAVDLATRAVTPDVAGIGSDAVARWQGGLLYVVNRYGQDNIQVVDPAQGYATVRQFSTGNGTNPQDIAFVTPTRAYVSLYERAFLLVVNPATGAAIGSIPLAGLADADGLPEAARMARWGPWVFVALQRLDRDAGFQPLHPSFVAVVDSRADTLYDTDPLVPGTQGIALAGRNPVTTFAYDPASRRLLVGCAGRYGQLDGGIEWLDPKTLASAGYAATEGALGGDVGDVVWGSGTRSYAIVNDAAYNTSLISWSPATGLKLGTVFAPGGFSLTDADLDDRGQLWVCRNDLLAPGLYAFQAGPDTPLAGPLDTGLPPSLIIFDAPIDPVAVEPRPPSGAGLAPPWPNPARGECVLLLSLPAAAAVELEAFDAAGRRVAGIAGGMRPAGLSRFTWRMNDEAARPLPPGLYLIRARAGDVVLTRRVALVR